ncbi:sensor histidine kinase [Arthrobacter sp. zg-Y20]|uniref:sensor histidine kinase n=1 Tax=unclassified Arthrobacter TaxID=235627 RepID=UPI001D1408FB|nr:MULTISPECIES: sensor histidine kinase [unclassified Arthrobacter]MCC3274631.1 sensor histidine kinase [Arthrobacter sp. zg-Y20]MDK1314788.1 sensor histidine kinase [Arthrobacter sp. zg.Y20]WIB04652.1 sensor histidine kinase [Arthrobacter sp. zg-Y20]
MSTSNTVSRGSGAPAIPSGTVLRFLRVALHVAFAGLLALALFQLTLDRPGTALLAAAYTGSLLLAVVYLAGTVAEQRYAAQGLGPDPERYGTGWLALVTGLWLVLLVVSEDFAWLAFPLFFLALHLLRTRPALVAVGCMAAAVTVARWAHTGMFTFADVLGPLIGALFAVVMGSAYSTLHAESVRQQRALEDLERTRSELALSQHDAGVLAERTRLAREIHDTLAQGFSSIVLMSRAAGTAMDNGDTGLARERLATVQETAAQNLAEARRFVRGLAATGDGGSLTAGLERLCAQVSRQAASGGRVLECTLRVDGEPRAMTEADETTLLRAARASLANVLSHSRASHAVVTLNFGDDAVTLDVFDDGAGFDSALLPEVPRADGSGFGLLSLRQRVDDLGGTLSVESAPGEGTVVAISLPLRRRSGT